MFDALADTADRMSKIEGRKAIMLITSGIDTFSKLTYDKTREALQEPACRFIRSRCCRCAHEVGRGAAGSTI